MADRQQKHRYAKIMEECDLSLEVVLLLILGVFMFLFGMLLFKIHTGDLPYNPDATYGLFLLLVSFQVITMGKTPFGDLRRSWALVTTGIATAILGMAACFIPGILTEFVRALVGIVLFASGIVLPIQLFRSGKKAGTWIRISGILRQLTFACGLVYVLTAISGLITLFPGLTTNPRTAVLLILYGTGFFHLAWCIRRVAELYPPENSNDSAPRPDADTFDSKRRFSLFREASLPLSPAILILLGILLTFLGLLLFPVHLGVLAFSPDGQLGMLMTIMAIQMMALGDTPLGRYKRSWLMITPGIAFAASGVVSCIVPGILTGKLQLLLGLLNIIGGALFFINRFLSMHHEPTTPPTEPVVVPPIFKKLTFTQTVLNLVTIAFGVSMLIPDLVSGFIIAGILVINGLLLFRFAAILQELAAMESGEVRRAF